MRIFQTLAATAAISAFATTTLAGGLSDEIIEPEVEVMEIDEPPTSSVSPVYIIVGVLAALLVVAALDEDDDDDEVDDL
ncbi:hypothetical protein [Yoonia sp. BS5-3]|uniref:Uncharacterized protein n=1 Tax=Yoonia phaeophyticola TaxID=3137369 RepID=A0ABZ2V7M8_9RHOB